MLLINSVRKTIQNEAKEQKGEFLGMLLGILGTMLLGTLLTCKYTIRAGKRPILVSQEQDTI